MSYSIILVQKSNEECVENDCMIDSYVSRLFTFSGAGNDFVVLDGRQGGMEPFRQPGRIGELCQEYHTDGLMILTLPSGEPGAEIRSDKIPGQAGNDDLGHVRNDGRAMVGSSRPSSYDFVMEFYNPDGSGGMMCGNGGRCIVAFANYLGINPANGHTYHFLAPDGEHTAQILSQEIPGEKWTVRLKMIDVQGITPIKDGLFLNTGTRHYVQFVDQVDSIDMEKTAKPIRWDAAFQPEGTNVNFVEVRADGLHVRTFEKGVEGETLACGTGLTACALAAYKAGVPSDNSYRLQCRRGDWLQVDFLPSAPSTPSAPSAPDTFTDVYLTGPAELVAIVA